MPTFSMCTVSCVTTSAEEILSPDGPNICCIKELASGLSITSYETKRIYGVGNDVK